MREDATRALALLLLAACSRPDGSAREARPDSAVIAITDTARRSMIMRTGSDTGSEAGTGRRSTLALTSPAFHDGASIPPRFTCDDADHSPPLAWSGAPAPTAAYALIVQDPDAPGGTFVHWVIYDLPAATTSLPEGVPKDASLPQLGGARQGRNDFGGPPGYRGPCPPPGPAHHYHFRLFALDRTLGLAPGATRAEVADAMSGHELARAELVGTYARRK